MNKTFFLRIQAAYTDGSMLIVYDSIEEFKKEFAAYCKAKQKALGGLDYYSSKKRKTLKGEAWQKAIDEHEKKEEQFITNYHNAEWFDVIDEGCTYIEKGEINAGWFFYKINIYREDEGECWLIVKEFMSDLPKGIHHISAHCA